MIRRISENGGVYHEPPYTWEEEMEFYRRVSGTKSLTIVHQQPAPTAVPTPHPQKIAAYS